MKWIEISLESENDITEEISFALMELGAAGTQIKNPDEIKSLIEKAGAKELADLGDFDYEYEKYIVTAYFPPTESFDETKAVLCEKFPAAGITWNEVDDAEWSGNWKKFYKPFNITERFRVIPSWEANGDEDEHCIIMDPGMAFGTGTHESTRLCARLVDENLNAGDRFLDIGTGTGILSIIASRCGSSHIVAIDVDDAAVRTAKENLAANKIINAEVFKGDLREAEDAFLKQKNRAPFVFDMIAVNIVSDVIIELAADMKRILKKGGRLVCSGIISEREGDVLRALDAQGFESFRIIRENEWTAMIANA